MIKPRKAVVTKKRTVHMYSELWQASRCMLDAGIREQQGSSWQFLSSAVLTAFAFEAYMNHVGPKVISCWPELERLSPWAKYELLCERLGVTISSSKSDRPLQTVLALFEFRNTMAHGRSAVVHHEPTQRDINDNLDRHLGEKPLLHWEYLVKDAQFATRARTDVEAVLKVLHESRPAPKETLFAHGIGHHRATSAPKP